MGSTIELKKLESAATRDGQMSDKDQIPAPLLESIRKIDDRGHTQREIWKTIRWVGVAAFTYFSIAELAGKQTDANLLLSLFVTVPERGVSAWWVMATFIAFAWAIVEGRIRRRKVQTLSGRIKALELKLDPKRTSSGLTSSGETPDP